MPPINARAPAAANPETRLIEMLRRCTAPELRETANGFDPEDGSLLPPVVMGVPRQRAMELARWVMMQPKGAKLGEGPVAPPPPTTSGKSSVGMFVGLGVVGLLGFWWLSRSAPRRSKGSEE